MRFMVSHTLPAGLPTDRSLLEIVDRFIPATAVTEAVDQTARKGQRRRKLPGGLLTLLFVVMHLVPIAALDTVLATVLVGFRLRSLGTASIPATESGISHARYRWGVQSLVLLFRQVCRPLATTETIGAWLDEYRLMALDTSIDDVADTPENDRAFGRSSGQHGDGSYPQLMGAYLLECGTHAIVDAGFWPRHASVHRAAKRLVRSITPEMLVLVDQGLHSFALVRAIRAQGAHLLFRIMLRQTFEPIALLPDGSVLALLHAVCSTRRTRKTDRILVRILTYTHCDRARVGYRERHRLLTTLLDHRRFPARRLIATYHERWEVETAFDEMGTHQRLAAEPFRAKRPVGVLQEAYGLVLAHYVVRGLMYEAACVHGLDPDRLSFIHALRLTTVLLPLFQVTEPAEHEGLYHWLLQEIARYRLPPRALRIAPRACKRPRSKHRLRRQAGPYRIVRVKAFDEVVDLLPYQDDALPVPTTA